jgi:hypothetical protein
VDDLVIWTLALLGQPHDWLSRRLDQTAHK